MPLTGSGGMVLSAATPSLGWETTQHTGVRRFPRETAWESYVKESPDLVVASRRNLGWDGSWYQRGSPQGTPDWRIFFPPLLFLSHFSTCPKAPELGYNQRMRFWMSEDLHCFMRAQHQCGLSPLTLLLLPESPRSPWRVQNVTCHSTRYITLECPWVRALSTWKQMCSQCGQYESLTILAF